jgi:hypothetical protein
MRLPRYARNDQNFHLNQRFPVKGIWLMETGYYSRAEFYHRRPGLPAGSATGPAAGLMATREIFTTL